MTLSFDARVTRGDFAVSATFTASAGETVALLGPNGSGKTTVVECLAGIVPPVSGTVELDGGTMDDPSAAIHVPSEDRPIGIVFQDGLLFPHLAAIENVAFPLRAAGASKAEARKRAVTLLERLGFPLGRVEARPSDLSGGEAQRVALARALIREPRLLLLDEPTSSLDIRSRAEVRGIIGSTLADFTGARVLVTHDPVEAMTLADQIVVLEDGRVTQSGSPGELRNAPRTPYVADLVGVNMFKGRLQPLDDGAGLIVTAEGELAVAWPAGLDRLPIEGVVAIVRPIDVAVHVDRPEGSPRNVLHGRIAEVAVEGDRARIRLDSTPPIVAEMTLGSLERLALRSGGHAWASFKAVEIELVLP
jgi:molybdate transport system ATP-binding protein